MSTPPAQPEAEPTPASATEEKRKQRIFELTLATLALAGILGSGYLTYRAATDAQTNQFFMQERRQAYADFYASVLASTSLSEQMRNSGSIGPGSDTDPSTTVASADATETIDDLTSKLALLELIGTKEIGDIASDIVKVRTYAEIARVLSASGQEVPRPSDYNLDLETYEESLLDDTDGDAQLYDNFLEQARQDLDSNDN